MPILAVGTHVDYVFRESAREQATAAPFFFGEDSVATAWTEQTKMKSMKYSAALDAEFSKRMDETKLQENVVFIFDEARHLMYGKDSKPVSNFLHLRRAFTHFSCDGKYLCPIAVMTDTTAEISNLAPVRDVDSSA